MIMHYKEEGEEYEEAWILVVCTEPSMNMQLYPKDRKRKGGRSQK